MKLEADLTLLRGRLLSNSDNAAPATHAPPVAAASGTNLEAAATDAMAVPLAVASNTAAACPAYLRASCGAVGLRVTAKGNGDCEPIREFEVETIAIAGLALTVGALRFMFGKFPVVFVFYRASIDRMGHHEPAIRNCVFVLPSTFTELLVRIESTKPSGLTVSQRHCLCK